MQKMGHNNIVHCLRLHITRVYRAFRMGTVKVRATIGSWLF